MEITFCQGVYPTKILLAVSACEQSECAQRHAALYKTLSGSYTSPSASSELYIPGCCSFKNRMQSSEPLAKVP